MRLISYLIVACLLSSCSTKNPYYDASQPHHTPDGFQNTEAFSLPSGGDLLRWYWQRLTGPKPLHEPNDVPWQAVDHSVINQPTPDLQVTWLGHATVLIQSHGINVLTDPMLTTRASPFSWLGPKRQTPVPIAIDELPHIDVIVISHNHYDHLDLPTLKAIDKKQAQPPLVVVPLGDAARLKRAGLRKVKELDWWQSLVTEHAKPMTISLTPARHWSLRQFIPSDRNRSLWGSFVVSHQQQSVFFAGDTGYAPVFKDIGQRFGPFALAILPIGAYEPREYLKAQHVNPAEAVTMHKDLRAQVSLPIHWGTFILSSELLQQPPEELAQALENTRIAADDFSSWAIGETRAMTPRTP
ncbi:MAG: MBL fold metallo-hydrolase [Moraxellaceae bacterium]|nr:MBL fold metallo-hydrolase [Moraxellaceae bacterium]MDP1776198.1 MBL fold metallo-hydrolase [Moraxellaceae bacterium]